MESRRHTSKGSKFVIGLTGGIGSGKSTVARLFEELGAGVVDTDVIARRLTGPGGGAIDAVAREFGAAYVDAAGALDRARMRELVFADPGAKARLEVILHPLIRQETHLQLESQQAAYIFLVVPLLLETGAYHELIARILVVDCSEATQISRTMQRSALSEAQVKAIMATQASRQTRLANADDVLSNEGGIEDLLPRVDQLHRNYLALAAARAHSSSP